MPCFNIKTAQCHDCCRWTGYRPFTVALLPQLKQLDGQPITPLERIQAFQELPKLRQSLAAEIQRLKETPGRFLCKKQALNRCKNKTKCPVTHCLSYKIVPPFPIWYKHALEPWCDFSRRSPKWIYKGKPEKDVPRDVTGKVGRCLRQIAKGLGKILSKADSLMKLFPTRELCQTVSFLPCISILFVLS